MLQTLELSAESHGLLPLQANHDSGARVAERVRRLAERATGCLMQLLEAGTVEPLNTRVALDRIFVTGDVGVHACFLRLLTLMLGYVRDDGLPLRARPWDQDVFARASVRRWVRQQTVRQHRGDCRRFKVLVRAVLRAIQLRLFIYTHSRELRSDEQEDLRREWGLIPPASTMSGLRGGALAESLPHRLQSANQQPGYEVLITYNGFSIFVLFLKAN